MVQSSHHLYKTSVISVYPSLCHVQISTVYADSVIRLIITLMVCVCFKVNMQICVCPRSVHLEYPVLCGYHGKGVGKVLR